MRIATLDAPFAIRNSQFAIRNFQFSIFNFQFSIFNFQFSMLYPRSSILYPQSSVSSFVPQRDYRVYLRCAPRGNPASQQCDRHKQRGNAGEGQRISRADTEQQASH
jgi:hypothetical protein